MQEFVPGRGDVIWIEFNPQLGHEQKGLRPAVVLSPKSYNNLTSLAILCPITTSERGYPYEVKIPKGYRVDGVILSDQIKSLDWRARHAQLLSTLPMAVIDEVLAKLKTLI